MASKKISDLTAKTDIESTDLLVIETAGGLSRKTTPAKIFTDIAASANPAGVILPYGGLIAPSGYLLCNGASVSKTTYASLWAALSASKGAATITIAAPGVITNNGHGLITGDVISFTTTGALPTGLTASTSYYVIYNDVNSFWLATSYANALAGTKITTSGSQSGTHTLTHNPYGVASATNFYIPDMRAAFPRGVGTSTAFTTNETIPQGSILNDQLQNITGTLTGALPGGTAMTATGALSASTAAGQSAGTSVSGRGVQVLDFSAANSTGARTGDETRPKSVGVNYIIKY